MQTDMLTWLVCGVWSEHWQADLPLLQPLKQGSSNLSLEGQSAAEFSSNPDQLDIVRVYIMVYRHTGISLQPYQQIRWAVGGDCSRPQSGEFRQAASEPNSAFQNKIILSTHWFWKWLIIIKMLNIGADNRSTPTLCMTWEQFAF